MANSVWLELAKRVGLQLATAGSWWTRNCAHDGARVLPWKPQALRPLGFGCECQSTVDFECRWLQKVVNSWAGQLLSSFGFIVKRCKKSKSQGDKLFWDAKLAVLQQCQGRSLLKALRWTTDWHWFSLQCADRFPAFWSKQGGWMMDDVGMLGLQCVS